MKTLIGLLLIILIPLGVIGLSSCEKKNTDNTGSGKLEISMNFPDATGLTKSGSLDSIGIDSYQLLVSIEDMDGNQVLSDSLIPIYTFGTGYVSEEVELQAGEFRLTKFMVIDAAGKVLYAAPVAGSPLAYLIKNPLPLGFSIFPDKVTEISPEVLATGDQPPEQFGYASFGMQIIKPLVFWAICTSDSSVLSQEQMTQAYLTVYADNCGWHYTFRLEAAVNRLIIRGGSEIYTLILEKEGYPSQKMQFSARDLLATSKENPLVLKIQCDSTTWSEDFEAYDEGTFPYTWIADGNATNHSYFLSDPVFSIPLPRKGDSYNNIDSTISFQGKKSLHLYGFIGGCWAAIAYHNLNATPPFTLEFAIRNGNESLSGCNPDRAYVGLNEGTSWTNPAQRTFIIFDGNGKVYGGGGKELGLYNSNTWYLVKVRYERISTSEIKLSYRINNNNCGSETLSTINGENLLKYLEIQVLEGSAWYDNIRIIQN